VGTRGLILTAGAGLGLLLVGASSRPPPPNLLQASGLGAPALFDASGCGGVQDLLAKGGTDLQRSEVVGTYLIDPGEFAERYVTTRMKPYGRVGLTDREVPSEFDVRHAKGAEVERLTALRREAEIDFRAEAPEAYQGAGPVLALELDGTWTSRRRDDGAVVSGGRYITRGRLVLLLDDLYAEAPARGPVRVPLTFADGTLACDQLTSILLRWGDRGARTYRPVRGEARATGPAATLPVPVVVRRAQVVGTWRVRPLTIRPTLRLMRETGDALREVGPQADPTLRALVALSEVQDPLETLSWRFFEDGSLVGAVLENGAWHTIACGRWILAGDTVVVASGPPEAPSLGPRGEVDIFWWREHTLRQRRHSADFVFDRR
jgi:hypothetical protein